MNHLLAFFRKTSVITAATLVAVAFRAESDRGVAVTGSLLEREMMASVRMAFCNAVLKSEPKSKLSSVAAVITDVLRKKSE